MTDTEIQPDKRMKFSPTEGLYLAGVCLLFIGLWVWMGIGEALTGTGGALIGSALLNDWMKHREAMNATV